MRVLQQIFIGIDQYEYGMIAYFLSSFFQILYTFIFNVSLNPGKPNSLNLEY